MTRQINYKGFDLLYDSETYLNEFGVYWFITTRSHKTNKIKHYVVKYYKNNPYGIYHKRNIWGFIKELKDYDKRQQRVS